MTMLAIDVRLFELVQVDSLCLCRVRCLRAGYLLSRGCSSVSSKGTTKAKLGNKKRLQCVEKRASAIAASSPNSRQ